MARPDMPPVPFQFFGQPETYYLAVRLYQDTVSARVVEECEHPTPRDIVRVMLDDANALKAAKERGEIV